MNGVNLKRKYHHGDLRAALIEAGMSLLAERAANDLSLREIARLAGVTATSVYRHFPDKAALLAALGREGLERLAAAQHAAFETVGGGADGFAATGRAYVRFALDNPALFRLIFSSPATENPLADPEESGQSEALAFLLANAASASAQSPGRSPRTAALRAWSVAHGLAMLMLDGQVPLDEALIDEAIGG